MKQLYLFLILLFFAGITYAIEEGQIITQQQINNFQLQNINTTFLQCRTEAMTDIYFHYSCLDIEIYNTTYIAVRINHTVEYPLYIPYLNYPSEKLREYVIGRINSDIMQRVTRTKMKVETYKTGTKLNLYWIWLKNYNPFL